MTILEITQTVFFFCGGFEVQLELSGLDLFEAGT